MYISNITVAGGNEDKNFLIVMFYTDCVDRVSQQTGDSRKNFVIDKPQQFYVGLFKKDLAPFFFFYWNKNNNHSHI